MITQEMAPRPVEVRGPRSAGYSRTLAEKINRLKADFYDVALQTVPCLLVFRRTTAEEKRTET